MKVTLLVRAPKKPEKRVVVEHDVLIGRGKDCNLRVLSNDVSRRHCQLVIGESEVAVRDLGSGNGTLLNSQKTDPNVDVSLISGDIVRIGPLVMKVEFESTSTPCETIDPEVRTEPGNSLPIQADTPQEEPSVSDAGAMVIADEPDADQFLESDDDAVIPDEKSAGDEVAGVDSAVLAAEEPMVEASTEAEQQAGKMKSRFGLFGNKKSDEETAGDGNVETTDGNPASGAEPATAEPLLVADNANVDEETVVISQGNAFTPDEDELELLADDDESPSKEGDFLDEDVENSPVDLGFADFLNNVDPPPQ